jgi:hypothetical protein
MRRFCGRGAEWSGTEVPRNEHAAAEMVQRRPQQREVTE